MIVEKRDGELVNFDFTKIVNAIEKAGGNKTSIVRSLLIKDLMAIFTEKMKDTKQISIQEIQTIVENALMKYVPDVARKYIEYRHDRDTIRESKSELYKSIDGLINRTNKDALTENANKDSRVFPTQRDLLAGIISKHYAKKMILPKDIVDAHESGIIHYHDLDYSPFAPMSNCCLVDLTNMLEHGFKMGTAEIEQPNSINVACALMSQITAQVASNQYGGTTFANVDIVLAPYVTKTQDKFKKDVAEYNITDGERYVHEKTEKAVNDAFQSYLYEVNTLFSSNGQTPFVTISFGTGTSYESRLIQKAILNNQIRGLGKNNNTPIFPKLTMFIEDGVNLKKEDPCYDIKLLALECSSKRMYPDIISVKNNKTITGSSTPVSPMGCRSFLSVWKDETGKEVLDGRNNLGVVTLNLPRIALDLLSKDNDISIDSYIDELDIRLQTVKKALLTRIKSFENTKASVAPILYTEGAFGVRLKPDDYIANLFKNGRSSISVGYIGIHEATLLMFSNNVYSHPFDNKLMQEFGKIILNHINTKLDEWKVESGYAFSLYSTPAENLCYRFCKIDKEIYGDVKGVTDKGWYTNSFHLDVDKKVTPFEKIDYEADYHYIAKGGHISYVEFPDMKNNLKALEQTWDYAIDKLDYFGTNTPTDKCFKCGSTKEAIPTEHGFHCSVCGNTDPETMQVTRRTCGYLGNPTVRGFNDGKNKEMMNRTKHVK